MRSLDFGSLQLEIRDEVKKRNIEVLFHFTKIENLESIMDDGLVPRTVLEEAAHPYSFTDRYRMDGRPDTISLSVSDINYAMFENKRKAYPYSSWVVLLLDPAVLWSKKCRFCERNAASRVMTAKKGAQAGVESFQDLFFDGNGNDCGSFPARNDAEVLVYGQIETSYICGAWTDRKDLADYVQEQLDRISNEDLTTYLAPFEWPGLYA